MHNIIKLAISCDNARTTSLIEKHLSKSHSISSTYYTAASGFSVAKEIGSAEDAGDAGIVIVGIDSEEAARRVRDAGCQLLHITTPMQYLKISRQGGDEIIFDYGIEVLLEMLDDYVSGRVLKLQRNHQAA